MTFGNYSQKPSRYNRHHNVLGVKKDPRRVRKSRRSLARRSSAAQLSESYTQRLFIPHWRKVSQVNCCQVLILRALLEDRLKTVNRSLYNYEKSLPRSHVTSDRTPRDFNNLAEISSVTEVSKKFHELIGFAERYLRIKPVEP